MYLITVIVPIYNSEQYLFQCLDSLVKQDLYRIEIILVNDGSTDRSLEICQNYKKIDERIVIINKQHEGVVAARFDALKIARGRYIVFVDSDDYVAVNMCSVIYNAIILNCSDICLFNEIAVYNDNVLFYGKNIDLLEAKNKSLIYDDEKKIILNYGSACGCLYKKEILLSTMKYVDKRIFFGEDTLWTYASMFKAKKIRSISDRLYYYRKHDQQTTSRYNEDMLDNFILFTKKLDEIIKELCNDKNREEIYYRYIDNLKNIFINEVKLDNKCINTIIRYRTILTDECIYNFILQMKGTIKYKKLRKLDWIFWFIVSNKLYIILGIIMCFLIKSKKIYNYIYAK